MRELEGRSYAEIGEILELSPSAVETLIFRARRALREQLETSLTCGEAELAISRQLDGRLSRADKAALRGHLRECKECSTFARRQRAQRTAIKSLAAIPVPTSLTSLFGGGGAAVGTGLALKAATAVTVGAIVGGAGYEGVQHAVRRHHIAPQATPTASSSKVANATGAKVTSERTHPSARAGSAAAAPATASHGKKTGHLKYHGDASIAARHNHLKPKRSHPSHPTAGSRGRSATAPGHARPKPKPVPPGPYDAGPAQKSQSHSHGGGGGGGGHGKGK